LVAPRSSSASERFGSGCRGLAAREAVLGIAKVMIERMV
jgi:hypothetical protein